MERTRDQVQLGATRLDVVEEDGIPSLAPPLRWLMEYFEEKTGGMRMARRSDIDPVQLTHFLRRICIFEPIFSADGELDDIMVRLMGTETAGFYGEMTGDSVKNHRSREVVARIFESVGMLLESGRPVTGFARELSGEKNHLRIQSLFVPLSTDGETIDKIFVYVEVSENQP